MAAVKRWSATFNAYAGRRIGSTLPSAGGVQQNVDQAAISRRLFSNKSVRR
jgi:hypothetical protein